MVTYRDTLKNIQPVSAFRVAIANASLFAIGLSFTNMISAITQYLLVDSTPVVSESLAFLFTTLVSILIATLATQTCPTCGSPEPEETPLPTKTFSRREINRR